MTTQDLHDLKQLFEFAILTGDKPELTKSDCEIVVAAVDRVLKSEWLEIESAPRDGTKILLCRSSDADGEPITGNDFGLFVQRAAWWDSEGWVVYCSLPCEPQLFFEPTHWKPIPDPPKASV